MSSPFALAPCRIRRFVMRCAGVGKISTIKWCDKAGLVLPYQVDDFPVIWSVLSDWTTTGPRFDDSWVWGRGRTSCDMTSRDWLVHVDMFKQPANILSTNSVLRSAFTSRHSQVACNLIRNVFDTKQEVFYQTPASNTHTGLSVAHRFLIWSVRRFCTSVVLAGIKASL